MRLREIRPNHCFYDTLMVCYSIAPVSMGTEQSASTKIAVSRESFMAEKGDLSVCR